MIFEGGCHCGATRYTASGEPQHVSVCHCSDCRKSTGAPFVTWAAFQAADFTSNGELSVYNSSGNAMRHFCGQCGTGLYYVNEDILPGLVDIQTCTLDDPEQLPPQIHVQHAERVHWTQTLENLPKFERYPG